VYRVRFLIELPSHQVDFDYAVEKDQSSMGSILLSHYPLDPAESRSLISVQNIINHSGGQR